MTTAQDSADPLELLNASTFSRPAASSQTKPKAITNVIYYEGDIAEQANLGIVLVATSAVVFYVRLEMLSRSFYMATWSN